MNTSTSKNAKSAPDSCGRRGGIGGDRSTPKAFASKRMRDGAIRCFLVAEDYNAWIVPVLMIFTGTERKRSGSFFSISAGSAVL